MTDNIGEKVKELRTSSKMTLKELSEKTDLSTGFLSQFERGLTTIAIDSLHKISRALSVDITFFFESPPASRGATLKSYQQPLIQVLNSTIYRSLSNDLQGKTILPRLVEILPSAGPAAQKAQFPPPEIADFPLAEAGGESGPQSGGEALEAFAHGGEEFLYVLEGVLTLVLGGNSHDLYPGDSAHYSSSLPHNWANHTGRTVKFIAINVPNDLAGQIHFKA